jgi:hypothetical protein
MIAEVLRWALIAVVLLAAAIGLRFITCGTACAAYAEWIRGEAVSRPTRASRRSASDPHR